MKKKTGNVLGLFEDPILCRIIADGLPKVLLKARSGNLSCSYWHYFNLQLNSKYVFHSLGRNLIFISKFPKPSLYVQIYG